MGGGGGLERWRYGHVAGRKWRPHSWTIPIVDLGRFPFPSMYRKITFAEEEDRKDQG